MRSRRALPIVIPAVAILGLTCAPTPTEPLTWTDAPAAARVDPGDQGDGLRQVSARAATTWSGTLAAGIKAIPRAREVRTGYSRDLFKHWVDADHDGCDTRDEVLIAEAVTAPTVGAGCALSGGKWFSYYDSQTTTKPSTFDVDHMVPLAEAWDSGARRWTAGTRQRYANDLRAPRSLVAVTAASNRSKSDQDPAEWLPAKRRCRYAVDWVSTKIRWSLTANLAEKKALNALAAKCGTGTFKVARAKVATTSTTDQPTSSQPPASSAGTVKVSTIVYDPPGSDTAATANQEYIQVTNPGSDPVALKGWRIKDAAGNTYTFGTFTLAAGASVAVHSGAGTDSKSDVFAGWGHIWNNTGDTANVIRADGSISDQVTYPGGGSGRVDF